ncbi:ankyrin repeat-containing domain protein [Trichoderma sp. SZMC 28015]
MSISGRQNRPSINADNSGLGSQYVLEGAGDQNVVYGNGTMVKHHQHFNITLQNGKNGKMGIPPSVGQFLQKYGGAESWPQEPSDGNIFKWLTTQPNQSPLNFSQYQRNLFVQLSRGTGKWILNSEEFLKWKEASEASKPDRIMWMQGILGSGKTMLLSVIIDFIEKQIQSQDEAACIYFFFQAEKHAVPLARIWATLLTQLLSANSSNMASALKNKFTSPFKRSAALDSSEYFDLFKAQVATVKTVYLVIDALDSCQNAPREATLKGFLKALVDLPDNVRILFTSRDNYIGKDIGANRELSITPREADVSTYVKNRIADDRRLRSVLFRAEHQEEIVKGVTTRAMSSKMFLSAKLHMDHLSKQRTTVFDIMQALNHLPDSALGAFKTLAKQIAQKVKANKGNGELLLTKHILLWVSHTKVDMNIEQIQDSFAIQKSKGNCYEDHRPAKGIVMRDCTGLVKTEKETFGLVHKSVKQHLLQYEIVSNDADLEIGKTCLYFLINTCKKKESSPLLQYAAKCWWSHLNSKAQVFDENTDSLVMRFLTDGPNLTRAFEAMEEAGGSAFKGMTGWHAAVHFDLLSWAERLPYNIDVDARCSDGQTALHWAVRYGRRKFVELLISKSASLNLRDQAGDTPLHKALVGPATDNVAIMEALIRADAQLDIPNEKGVSPLKTVIQYGPTSIARLMIESRKDVNAEISEDWALLRYVFSQAQQIFGVVDQGDLQTEHGDWSRLQVAVEDHVHFLIELLLERGVDLNRPSTKDGWTPLVFAASKGDLLLMRRLLTRKPNPARVDLQGPEKKTPLWWATHYGMAGAIQLLVDYGANGNETCGDGSTPLHEAVKKKSSKLVQLFVSLKADVNAKVRNGSTLLIETIKLKDHDTAWVLLNAGARPNEQDANGKSPLFYAIERQDNNLIWLLINKGASVTAPSLAKKTGGKNTGMYMQTPLEQALRRKNHSVAWLLCKHGASPDAVIDETGRTLLHLATYSGDLEAVHLLIQRGASTTVQGEGGLTPLHHAVLLEREDIVTLLTSHIAGASSFDVTDVYGNTALSLATQKQNLTITEILVRRGASCKAAGSKGLTPVHHAARLGFKTGLRLLLDGGGNANSADDNSFTPAHHAVNGSSDPGLVKMLAENDANLNAGDRSGRTPLMLAAQLGKQELVACLLDVGADAGVKDAGGYTAYHYGENYPDIQELLRARG